ncbi:MAG: Ig-like domain-containing protein [Limisphaerales bacterium]
MSTPDLTVPLSLWTPLEDAFSDDINVSVGISTTNQSIGFFSVEIPTNGTLPAVQIFSPTNNQIVSGAIAIGVGAQIGTQIQGVNLYLDDALVGFIDSGGIQFNLDTTHFTNGLHTLYVSAVDTANNQTPSDAITLDFENPVRWLDACSMFNSFVPIDVESDIYPADWLVSVTDTNGTIVRTISGSTSDGNINTSWDGTDNNGQSLSVENLYQITVDVTETGDGSSMMSSSVASTLGATSVAGTTNSHGVPEYTVQKPAPNPLTAYLENLTIYDQLTPEEKLIYPPLPDQPANNPHATSTVKMSAREMFLVRHQTSGATSSMAAGAATPDAGSASGFGSTRTFVWWEKSWQSQQIVLARVPIPGSFGSTVENDCNQIDELITEAEDTVGNNRGVFNTTVQVINNDSDVYGLTNQFANPNVTACYLYIHGTASGNAIGTQTAVIGAKSLGKLLGNSYLSSLPASWGSFSGEPAMITHKPFNFVFLDGCNTGLGSFPEAFGIPKVVSGKVLDDNHLHSRAFMGWSGPVIFQFDDTHLKWTLEFWTFWMDNGDGDKTLTDAIQDAYSHYPSVRNNVPIIWYGNGSLTWSK